MNNTTFPAYNHRLLKFLNLGLSVFERAHLLNGEGEGFGRVSPNVVDTTPLALAEMLKSCSRRSLEVRVCIGNNGL